MAVNSLSARDKLPLFGAVGHPAFTSSNPFAWQFWVSSDDEGGAIARAALKRDIKRIAVLTVDDEWTVTVSDGFRAAFTAGGGTLVMDESVLPTETDIKPLLMKVARRKADALFLNVGITQLGVGIKQARELGLTYPIYSTFWCATPDVLQTAGGAANGVTFVEMETNFPSFVRDVADCASNPPSAAVLSTYAATKFALQVLAAHPETRTMEQFATALGREREIKLPDISIPIQDRQIKFPVSVREIRNGRPEPAE
jgi:ABC-type branched-subunit amino acid transport system substrate-binding protein